MPWRRFAEGELLCPICLGLIVEPLTAPTCGHSFCRNCLVQSLQKANQRCPACRHTILAAPESLPINITLRNIAQKLFPEEYAAREAEAQRERAGWGAKLPLFVAVDPVTSQPSQLAFPGLTLSLHMAAPRYRHMVEVICCGRKGVPLSEGDVVAASAAPAGVADGGGVGIASSAASGVGSVSSGAPSACGCGCDKGAGSQHSHSPAGGAAATVSHSSGSAASNVGNGVSSSSSNSFASSGGGGGGGGLGLRIRPPSGPAVMQDMEAAFISQPNSPTVAVAGAGGSGGGGGQGQKGCATGCRFGYVTTSQPIAGVTVGVVAAITAVRQLPDSVGGGYLVTAKCISRFKVLEVWEEPLTSVTSPSASGATSGVTPSAAAPFVPGRGQGLQWARIEAIRDQEEAAVALLATEAGQALAAAGQYMAQQASSLAMAALTPHSRDTAGGNKDGISAGTGVPYSGDGSDILVNHEGNVYFPSDHSVSTAVGSRFEVTSAPHSGISSGASTALPAEGRSGPSSGASSRPTSFGSRGSRSSDDNAGLGGISSSGEMGAGAGGVTNIVGQQQQGETVRFSQYDANGGSGDVSPSAVAVASTPSALVPPPIVAAVAGPSDLLRALQAHTARGMAGLPALSPIDVVTAILTLTGANGPQPLGGGSGPYQLSGGGGAGPIAANGGGSGGGVSPAVQAQITQQHQALVPAAAGLPSHQQQQGGFAANAGGAGDAATADRRASMKARELALAVWRNFGALRVAALSFLASLSAEDIARLTQAIGPLPLDVTPGGASRLSFWLAAALPLPDDWRSHLMGMSSLGERMWVLLQLIWDHAGRPPTDLSLDAACEYVQCATDVMSVHSALRRAEAALLPRAQTAVAAAATVVHLTGAHALSVPSPASSTSPSASSAAARPQPQPQQQQQNPQQYQHQQGGINADASSEGDYAMGGM